jgi:hypothetical protein
LASSLQRIADERDPFTLPDFRENDEDLPSLFKLPHLPSKAPTSLPSSSLPSAFVSSIGSSSRHRSQSSQIVPTSQFDEVELFAPETQSISPSVHSQHDKTASSTERYPCLVSPVQRSFDDLCRSGWNVNAHQT